MGFGPARPPVTEDIAGVIVKDIKSGEGKGATSEVPMAFQTGARAPIDPVALKTTRTKLIMFGGIIVAVLIALWLSV
jgi:hypothetical protein